MPATSVTQLHGPKGIKIWNRIKDHLHLVTECSELIDSFGPYGAETKARLLTFFQILAFGDDGKHDLRYASKLDRNRLLAGVDPHLVGVSIQGKEQVISVETELGQYREICLGFASGVSVVYPLNENAIKPYRQNQLPPHAFDETNLIPRRDGTAAGVFLGAAIYLPALERLFAGKEFREGEPRLLAQRIARQVLYFLPEVAIKGRGHSLRLYSRDQGELPRLYTAFSGRGQGEDLVQKIGFITDIIHPHQAETKHNDTRYELDLNDFNNRETSPARRADILLAWAWFLRWKQDRASRVLIKRLERAVPMVVRQKSRT